MRLSLGLSWATILFAAQSFGSDAYIYISTASEQPAPQSLSPEATRLLLARRLGLSRYHSLEGADESTLRTLNEFGGKQETLFSIDEQWLNPQRNLIVVEDVEHLEELLHRSIKPTFTMPNKPDSSQTLQLVKDLFRQALSQHGDRKVEGFATDCEEQALTVAKQSSEELCSSPPEHLEPSVFWAEYLQDTFRSVHSRTAIVHISLSGLAQSQNSSKPKSKQQLGEILNILLASGVSQESTIILMPPSNNKAKRTPTSPYGNYAMPNRRQAREGQTEAPLTAPLAPETTLPSHRVSTPQVFKASPLANPGILPACHPNLDKLIAATNNCSDHGTPYLKRPKSSDPKADEDCYACRCGKTVLSRGEGKGVKTVDWAGPACSKKDISMPFWLLAGISIALLATVSWGVGLLFSIGQEDLPSVIGAGVAGPRAQK
ncbi:MAG: hypothetical protein Q9182_003193 [Xanthomendoza sp. 2 TL-2023]